MISSAMQPSRPMRARVRGFTMTELIIVIAIAAILSAVAAPSFRNMIRNMAVRGAADELAAGFQFARSEAVRANQATRVKIQGRTWQVLSDTGTKPTVLRENTYSDRITPQPAELQFDFQPAGTLAATSSKGALSFPVYVCLSADGAPRVVRQVGFPARATSAVILEPASAEIEKQCP